MSAADPPIPAAWLGLPPILAAVPDADTAPAVGVGGNFDDAVPATPAAAALSAPVHVHDRLQRHGTVWQGRVSGSDRNMPILVCCAHRDCRPGGNAALRLVAAGYGDVCWHRGGLQAPMITGLQPVPSTF